VDIPLKNPVTNAEFWAMECDLRVPSSNCNANPDRRGFISMDAVCVVGAVVMSSFVDDKTIFSRVDENDDNGLLVVMMNAVMDDGNSRQFQQRVTRSKVTFCDRVFVVVIFIIVVSSLFVFVSSSLCIVTVSFV
jgi:hypothetical protein